MMPKFGSLKAQMNQGVHSKVDFFTGKNDNNIGEPICSLSDSEDSDINFINVKKDFRNLNEPDRTLARVNFILRHNELTPILKVATAILVQEFYGVETHRKQIKMNELFPATVGYTNRTRIETLARLEALGLIKKTVIHTKGQDITLLF